MKRKIIRQGHNTLTITLPSKWAKQYDIKAGDYAELTEQGRCLKIETDNNHAIQEQVLIDISGMPIPMVWRLVSSAYRNGHDEIKILFENNGDFNNLYTAFTYNTINPLQQKEDRNQMLSPLEAVQSLVNRFIGFETIEQRAGYCVIKDLGQTSSKELDTTIRRIFRLLNTMSEALLEAADGKKDEIKAFHIIDTNLDRFVDFCLRVLNKTGYSDFRKTSTVYTLIFMLELVGDEYKRLGLHLFEMKQMGKDLKKFVSWIDLMMKAYYDMYYNFSNEKAAAMYDMEVKGYTLFDEISPKLNAEEHEMAHHLKKIGKYMISLTELCIDLQD